MKRKSNPDLIPAYLVLASAVFMVLSMILYILDVDVYTFRYIPEEFFYGTEYNGIIFLNIIMPADLICSILMFVFWRKIPRGKAVLVSLAVPALWFAGCINDIYHNDLLLLPVAALILAAAVYTLKVNIRCSKIFYESQSKKDS